MCLDFGEQSVTRLHADEAVNFFSVFKKEQTGDAGNAVIGGQFRIFVRVDFGNL